MQRSAGRLEEHRIPCWLTRASRLNTIGSLDRFKPFTVFPPGHPNADVGIAFLRAAKPSRHHLAGSRLYESRRVTLRIRRAFVSEASGDDGGSIVRECNRGEQ